MRRQLSLAAAWGVILSGAATALAEAPASEAAQTPSPRIVHLEKSRHFALTFGGEKCTDLLPQELSRQALLMAARDQLGLVTRDAWLGDAMPSRGDNPPLAIRLSAGGLLRLEVVRGFGVAQQSVASREVKYADPLDYMQILTDAEGLSRGFFVESLKKAGFDGKPHALNPEADLPEDVAKLLDEMTFPSQFQAVRSLHALMAEAESPALLGALVRGYANLGMLTELHLCPAHKVFKARAMLYAQRAVVRDPKSAWALWHRAYALAAVGLNAAALADLKAADELVRQAKPKSPSRPEWVETLDAYCRYDFPQLDGLLQRTSLNELLYLRVLEQSGCNEMTADRGITFVPGMPRCYRLYDGLFRAAGVSLWHRVTTGGQAALGKYVYGQVEAMPDLPAGVAEIISNRPADEVPASPAECQTRKNLIAALLSASDDGEPSWAVLGHLIWEQSFAQIWQRVNFENNGLGIAPDEFLGQVEPLLADHPCRPFADAYTWNAAKRVTAIAALEKVPAEGVELQVEAISGQVPSPGNDRWRVLVQAALDRVSKTDHGLAMEIDSIVERDRAKIAKELLRVSPYSPLGRANLVMFDWDAAKPHAAAWEKAAARQPAVLEALGRHYARAEQYADAERCLKAAVEAVPSPDCYRRLAAVYKAQGKIARWKSTLDDFLDQPDYGLSHAMVCSEIAAYFASHHHWNKAMPYAEGAAECYSAWGLLTAGECHEAMQHWKQAETFFEGTSRQYPGSVEEWYRFCKRTGHGNLESARALSVAMMSNTNVPEKYRNQHLFLFYLLEKEHDKALAATADDFKKLGGPYMGLHLVLISDQLKKTDRCKAALEAIKAAKIPEGEKPHPALVGLAALIARDLEQGGKGEIDLAAAAKLADTAADFDRAHFRYFLGKYFSLHGKRDLAIQQWKTCMGCPRISYDSRSHTLAGAALMELGVKPEDYKDVIETPVDDQGRPLKKPEKARAGKAK